MKSTRSGEIRAVVILSIILGGGGLVWITMANPDKDSAEDSMLISACGHSQCRTAVAAAVHTWQSNT